MTETGKTGKEEKPPSPRCGGTKAGQTVASETLDRASERESLNWREKEYKKKRIGSPKGEKRTGQ